MCGLYFGHLDKLYFKYEKWFGGLLSIKMSSHQYRNPHVNDGLMTVLSLTWESPYLGKMVFILRWGPGAIIVREAMFAIFCKSFLILMVVSTQECLPVRLHCEWFNSSHRWRIVTGPRLKPAPQLHWNFGLEFQFYLYHVATYFTIS